jgi:hypothetical protein
MKLTIDDISEYVQIKPTRDLYETNVNGQVKYIFKSKNKYTPQNINIFAFIDSIKNYVFFDFKNVQVKDEGLDVKERYSYIFDPSSIKFKSNNLYLSKIDLTESITKKELLNEIKSEFPSKTTMRNIIKKAYRPCSDYSPIEGWSIGCLTTINNEDCETNEGIVGGKYTEGQYGGIGTWSLINRWDTNSSVHNEIKKIYEEEEGKKSTKKSQSLINDLTDHLKLWIHDNRFELFSNNGKWVDRLAKISVENFQEGKKNEEYGKRVIENIFNLDTNKENKDYKLNFYCGGSKNDTIKGQDLVLQYTGDKPIHFQIKPFSINQIKMFDSERGKYYRMASWNVHDKYKEENVDAIIYVSRETDEYIVFDNDHSKILTISNSNFHKSNEKGDIGIPFYIFYYEEPIKTNITLELQKSIQRDIHPRLQRNKEQLINQYKDNIKFYQNKLKELGIDDINITETIRYYKNKLKSLLYS